MDRAAGRPSHQRLWQRTVLVDQLGETFGTVVRVSSAGDVSLDNKEPLLRASGKPDATPLIAPEHARHLAGIIRLPPADAGLLFARNVALLFIWRNWKNPPVLDCVLDRVLTRITCRGIHDQKLTLIAVRNADSALVGVEAADFSPGGECPGAVRFSFQISRFKFLVF